MSAPLTVAGYLRPPKKSGTKAEVLARCFAAIANDDFKKPTMEDRLLELHEKEVWYANLEASFRPIWMAVGPVQPTYVDDRMREHRGKFGHTRSD
ncbi:hypothetical protein RQL81_19415 [Citrobacter braakii]|jgi:hypothetical protein|uniref:hypothetical protein n=1 Tax=Citrobacter sp. Res13-Sevr-PEB04-36 TaxID=2777960 RepID=UPI0018ACCB84|nr:MULTISPECIES: hypothetical protein [Citrobacter]MCI1672396.1 hypothetical protein [Citrobacter freundii]MCI1828393.1 hypothetical protein [Citrobacter freundii]MDT7116707.1 hypothetical protein [Citrobacter braakii]